MVLECYHPHFAMITDETAKEMKENGIEINTWTVNDEETMKDLISKGADILIGNYPDLTKKVIEVPKMTAEKSERRTF